MPVKRLEANVMSGQSQLQVRVSHRSVPPTWKMVARQECAWWRIFPFTAFS